MTTLTIKYHDVETPVTITDPQSFTITAPSLTYTTKTTAKTEMVTINMTAIDYVTVTISHS